MYRSIVVVDDVNDVGVVPLVLEEEVVGNLRSTCKFIS
jgi:hypothetical protein